MDDNQIEELLRLGTIDEQIAEQLRSAKDYQQLSETVPDATAGRDYTTEVRGGVVANPGQAIADMFIRGKQEREKKQHKYASEAMQAKADDNRTLRDTITKSYTDAVTGNVVDKKPMTVTTPRIGTPPPVDISKEQAFLDQNKFTPPAPRPMPPPSPQPAVAGPAMQPAMPGAAAPMKMPTRPGQPQMDDATVQAVIDRLTAGA